MRKQMKYNDPYTENVIYEKRIRQRAELQNQRNLNARRAKMDEQK